MQAPLKRCQLGFSLIELLMVLAIMGILASCALIYNIPNYSASKLQLVSDELLHHLKYARTEAIKRNQKVGLCGMQDAQTCTQSWQAGYLIFVTDPRHPHHKEIIRIHSHIDNNITIVAEFNNRNNTVQFTPEGSAQKNGRITIRVNNSDLSQKIMVCFTGRSRLT